MPISASGTFDNTGAKYQIKAVITDGLFDSEKYAAYSPIFMSATFAVNYCLALAGFTAVVVHTYRKFLFFYHELPQLTFFSFSMVRW